MLGLFVMALGAGYGEEAFFRGFLQAGQSRKAVVVCSRPIRAACEIRRRRYRTAWSRPWAPSQPPPQDWHWPASSLDLSTPSRLFTSVSLARLAHAQDIGSSFGAVTGAAWATLAGVLFGLECSAEGLGAASLSHATYDFLAFLLLLTNWDNSSYSAGLKDGPNKLS